MKEIVDKAEHPIAFLKKYNRVLRLLKFIILICVIIIIAVVFFFWKLLYDRFPEQSNRTADYGRWEDFKGYSGLKIFPEECPGEADYRYYYSNEINPVSQIYLECIYDENTFEAEKARLESIQISYQNKVNKVQHDVKSFITEAYVLEYNWRECYEYALIFEDINAIVYIYLQNMDYDTVSFSKLFLPVNYGKAEEKICQYAFGYEGNLDSCVLVFE